VIECGGTFETVEENQLAGGETTYVQVVKTPIYNAVGEIIGLKCYECIHRSSQPPSYCPHDQLKSGGRKYSMDVLEEHLKGDFYFIAASLSDKNGRQIGSVHVLREITERLKLEEQLRQSQKMEAVGRLAGGITHDFNNLLTVINGYSELLISGMDKNHPMRHYLHEINKAGMRAATLTKQLLAFSRKQKMKMEIVNLNDIYNNYHLDPSAHFLQKPFTPIDLVGKIREALDAPPPPAE